MADLGAHGRSAPPLSILVTLVLAVALVVLAGADQPPPAAPVVAPQPAAAPAPAEPVSLATVRLPPAPAPTPIVTPAPPVPKPAPKPPAAAPVVLPPVTEAPTPEAEPEGDPVPEPRAEPAPRPTPSPEPVAVTPEAAREGRALLRLLEHGKGPSIEIAWPASAADRERLYGIFSRCHGMQLRLLDGAGRLFGPDDGPGVAWHRDPDRYSGFVRAAAGDLTAGERQLAARLRARHGLSEGQVVRVFPRRADALLLGGLQALLGDAYMAEGQVRATYRVAGRDVLVIGVHIDGRPVSGRVRLPSGPCPGA